MSEILGRGILTLETVKEDIEKVVAACTDWAGVHDIMIATGLGRGRVMPALERAGSRLEREARRRNTCEQRWVYRRRETT